MFNFRIPDVVIFAGIILNIFLLFYSMLLFDYMGSILSILCIGCFIFTYKVNQWERNEKKEKQKKDD